MELKAVHQVRRRFPLPLTVCRRVARVIRRPVHPRTPSPRAPRVRRATVAAETAGPTAAVTSETAGEARRTEPERTDTDSAAFASGSRGQRGRGAALLEKGGNQGP